MRNILTAIIFGFPYAQSAINNWTSFLFSKAFSATVWKRLRPGSAGSVAYPNRVSGQLPGLTIGAVCSTERVFLAPPGLNPRDKTASCPHFSRRVDLGRFR